MSDVPAPVLALAAALTQLGPRPPAPIAWAEHETHWCVVFEDGRKLYAFRTRLAPPSAGAAEPLAKPAAHAAPAAVRKKGRTK